MHIYVIFKAYLNKNTNIVEERLDGIDRYEIGNLEDLPKLVFIHKKCGNLKAVVDGGELIKNIN